MNGGAVPQSTVVGTRGARLKALSSASAATATTCTRGALVSLELQLRLSVIQGELLRLAEEIGGKRGRVIRYVASVLRLASKP